MTTPLNYNDVFALMQDFPADALNQHNQLIVDQSTGTFVSLHDCDTIRDVKTRVVFAICRKVAIGLSDHDTHRLLEHLNHYFHTDLTPEDLRRMYVELCYPHRIDTLTRFIERGFPVSELTPKSFCDYPPVR